MMQMDRFIRREQDERPDHLLSRRRRNAVEYVCTIFSNTVYVRFILDGRSDDPMKSDELMDAIDD
jgi:hypothetical protein